MIVAWSDTEIVADVGLPLLAAGREEVGWLLESEAAGW